MINYIYCLVENINNNIRQRQPGRAHQRRRRRRQHQALLRQQAAQQNAVNQNGNNIIQPDNHQAPAIDNQDARAPEFANNNDLEQPADKNQANKNMQDDLVEFAENNDIPANDQVVDNNHNDLALEFVDNNIEHVDDNNVNDGNIHDDQALQLAGNNANDYGEQNDYVRPRRRGRRLPARFDDYELGRGVVHHHGLPRVERLARRAWQGRRQRGHEARRDNVMHINEPELIEPVDEDAVQFVVENENNIEMVFQGIHNNDEHIEGLVNAQGEIQENEDVIQVEDVDLGNGMVLISQERDVELGNDIVIVNDQIGDEEEQELLIEYNMGLVGAITSDSDSVCSDNPGDLFIDV